MKALVVSDTHGRNENLLILIKKISPIDMLIHLGDFRGGEKDIRQSVSCPTEFVSGNNDFFTGYPKDKMITIGRYSIMMTHGHKYGVNYNTYALRQAAKMNKADIVMYGHTHVPMIDLKENIWLINPGSLSLPRQNGRIPTYIIMDIDPKGDAHFTLNYLNTNMVK